MQVTTLSQIHDEELYALCKKYGLQSKLWRQKFIGLLPEVNRRELFKSKGFSSIFEFAAKLCGLSAEQVRLTLNLEKRFEDKPTLKHMLTSGEASINKLTRIASIATIDNEKGQAEISNNIRPTASRYIPVEIKKIIKEEFGEKCSITTCKKPATVIHHTQAKITIQDFWRRFVENTMLSLIASI